MTDVEKRIKELSDKIEALQYRQYGLTNELQTLHNELYDLKRLLQEQPPTGDSKDAVLLKPAEDIPEKILEKTGSHKAAEACHQCCSETKAGRFYWYEPYK